MIPLTVIIPAGGSSSRFGSDKLSADLLGQRVIARTIAAFVTRDDVRQIIIGTDRRAELEPLIDVSSSKVEWSTAGATRAQTVRLAADRATEQWLAVHDAARPLVTQRLIDRVVIAAEEHLAAAPALPVVTTIKRAIGPLPAPVVETVSRDTLWSVQTPQIMRRDDYLSAWERTPIGTADITDDVQLLELAGQSVMLVDGDDSNIKLTTPIDLLLAVEIIRQRS